MRVHFYGRIGDRLGRSHKLELPEDAATVADLRQLLARTYPDAAGEIASPSLKVSVGDEIVGEGFDIRRASVVEFFPPVSGG